MFDDLFQLVGNREMKSLNSSNIGVGGLEPVSVVYIEVSNIENFSVWVFSQQRLMAGSKILKEGEKVSSISIYIWNFYVKINFKIQTCLFI